MKPRIVVIGSSNTDMIIKLPRLPRPGETVLGGEFFTAAGGKGANQAVAAARAGGDVTFIAKVGDDLFGKQAVEGFAFDGLHCQHVFVDKETRSGVALIFIDSIGENVIGVSSGANLKLTPEDVQQAGQAITEANLLLMQLESPPETVLAAARIAAKNRVPIMLNPAPAKPLDDELLQLITYLTPNESETEMLINTKFQDDTSYSLAANILFSRGVKNVLITLGNRGVFVAPQGQQKQLIAAFKVQTVDSTAAGDAFNGALAVALAEKRGLMDAVRFASAAATLSVSRLGAQPSLPFRQEIDSFLKSQSA